VEAAECADGDGVRKGQADTKGMLAKVLRSEGYAGWRRQQRISGQDAQGGPYRVQPDFIFRSRRIAIFVDDFLAWVSAAWHLAEGQSCLWE